MIGDYGRVVRLCEAAYTGAPGLWAAYVKCLGLQQAEASI